MIHYIILGKDTGLHNKINNFYRYDFASVPNNTNDKVIYEKKYLNEYKQKISFNHLAEFSAWYVFAKFNPLGLNDNDIVAFISGEKFEELTEISISGLQYFDWPIENFINDDRSVGFFYGFPYRNLEATYPEEWFWGHINESFWKPISIRSGLRSNFSNLPNINRNYIVCTMSSLRNFVSWIEEKLFKFFFTIDGWIPVMQNIELARQCPAVNGTAYKDRYRVFGMIIEFFHHRYFEEFGKQYIIHKNMDINRIVYDKDLNHKVENVYHKINEA